MCVRRGGSTPGSVEARPGTGARSPASTSAASATPATATAARVPSSVQPFAATRWRSTVAGAAGEVGGDGHDPLAVDGAAHASCCSVEPWRGQRSSPATSAQAKGTGATLRPCCSSRQHSSIAPPPVPPASSGRATPSRPVAASVAHSGRSIESSAASTALIRSTVDLAGEDVGGERRDRLLLVGEGEVHQAGANTGRVRSAPASSHWTATGHADLDVVGLHVDEVRHEAGALLEIDERDQQRVLERRHLRVVVDDEAVHGAPARRLDRVPLVLWQFGHIGPGGWRRVPHAGAALDQQPVLAGALEPERVVAVDRRAAAARGLRLAAAQRRRCRA